MNQELLAKVERQSKFLSLFNKLVLIAALAVYAFFSISIITQGEWFGFVPITSVLLGVILIHIFVEVALNHFALLRQQFSRSQSE